MPAVVVEPLKQRFSEINEVITSQNFFIEDLPSLLRRPSKSSLPLSLTLAFKRSVAMRLALSLSGPQSSVSAASIGPSK